MENYSEIFIAALKHELESLPRGAKARIAEHIGISAGRLADYLNGRVNTTEEIRRKIADFLGYKGSFYDLFMNNGRKLLAGETISSSFRPIGVLGLVPKDDKELFKIVARVERDTRLSLGVPLDDDRNNALGAVIHQGADYNTVGYPDSRKAGVRVPTTDTPDFSDALNFERVNPEIAAYLAKARKVLEGPQGEALKQIIDAFLK